MGFWYYFWTVNFIVAGSSFVLITRIVMVRSSRDRLDYGNVPVARFFKFQQTPRAVFRSLNNGTFEACALSKGSYLVTQATEKLCLINHI